MKITRLDIPFIAIFLALVVGSYVGFFKKHVSHLTTVRAQQGTYRDQIENFSMVAAELSAARKRIPALQEAIVHLEERIPQVEQINRFLHSIVAVADASGVEIEQLRPQPPVKSSRFRIVPSLIVAEADFSQLQAFLAQLHDLPQYVSIDKMTLKGMKGSGRVRITMILSAYYMEA